MVVHTLFHHSEFSAMLKETPWGGGSSHFFWIVSYLHELLEN